MNSHNFSMPNRQSLAGLVLYFLNGIRSVIKSAWVLFAAFFINIRNERLEPALPYVYLGIFVLAILLILHAFLAYRYFYYLIEKDELLIRKGYLKRVKLSIPFERIQNINIRQTVFQQLLGVVSLEVDTAGSSGKELKIIALKKDKAEELKKVLMEMRTGEQLPEVLTNESSSPNPETASNQIQTNQPSRTILGLDFIDLIKVGISENHLKSSILVVAVVFGFVQQLSEIFQDRLNEMEEQAKLVMIGAGIQLIVLLILIVLIAGFLFSIIRIILSHYDLKLVRNKKQYLIKMGLLNKKEWSLTFKKIQIYTYATNPLRDLLDFVTIQLSQAVSQEGSANQSSIIIPGVSSNKRRLIEEDLFPEMEQLTFQEFRPQPYFFRRMWIFSGWLPAAVLCSLYFLIEWWVIPLPVLWLLISFWLSRLAFRKRLFRISDEIFQSRHGAVGTVIHVAYLYKLQAVEMRQNLIQRFRGIASLRLLTAGGSSVNVSYIKQAEAWQLYQYLLYKIEISNKEWM